MRLVIIAIATLMLAACAADVESQEQPEQAPPADDFEELEGDLDALAIALEDLDLYEEELEYEDADLD